MSRIYKHVPLGSLLPVLLVFGLALAVPKTAGAQTFDFQRIERTLRDYTVVLDIKVELSFGVQTTEQEQHLLGTIVSDDGLVIFDGSGLDFEHPFAAVSGTTFKATPKHIDIATLDDKHYTGEYLGVDRFTHIGVLRIDNPNNDKFTPVKFAGGQTFRVGQWVALYMLLPKSVEPQLGADVGMLSAMVTTPEAFPLTVGFSDLQLTSVVFDENLRPVGVLGRMIDPTSSTNDASGMLEAMGQYELPMLGIITGERLDRLIAEPPKQGETDRAWLGITLQALTPDIAEFLDVKAAGGIIVNNIMKDSPAEKAGLKVGDVIYEVNDQPVDVDRDEKITMFQRTIAEMSPGTSVEFSVLRPSGDSLERLTEVVVLDKAPLAATDAPEYESKSLEFKVRDLVSSDYLYYNVDEENLSGVVVSELDRGGPASISGLQIGDVIQRVGSAPVTTIEELEQAMKEIDDSKPPEVIFFVWRENKTLFVNVKTDWQ